MSIYHITINYYPDTEDTSMETNVSPNAALELVFDFIQVNLGKEVDTSPRNKEADVITIKFEFDDITNPELRVALDNTHNRQFREMILLKFLGKEAGIDS